MLDKIKKQNDIKKAKNILETFAKYGFRKTSIEDIAYAIGISRQTIYKKLGSKEDCYQWAIDVYLYDMYTKIFTTLDNPSITPLSTLTDVFNILVGGGLEITSSSHGMEILNDVLQATQHSEEDWALRFRIRLEDFLKHHNCVLSDKAAGVAFAMISAEKGLLLETSAKSELLENVKLIIKSITDSGISNL